MERFLKNFATKRSPKSVTVYRSNLIIFLTWNLLYNENKLFMDIRKIELADFFDYCVTELKWNANRYHQMHSSLSSFSAWIENYFDDDYPMFRNLLPKIEKPVKENIREKTVLQKEDIREYFDSQYCRYIQGATLHKGKIYSTEGFTNSEGNRPAIRVIDLTAKQETYYDIMGLGFREEAEFISFYNDVCLYSDCSGNLYTVEF